MGSLSDRVFAFSFSFNSIIWLTLFFAPYTSAIHAAFDDRFIGARAYAMGGASSAVMKEVDGLLVNPASISSISAQQFSATMAMLHVGLSDETSITQNLIAYANSHSKRGAVGLLWKRLNVSQLYAENQVVLGASKSYRIGSGGSRQFSIGASGKLLNWETVPTLDANGAVLEDLPGRSQLSVDIGFVFRSSTNIPIALSVQNLNSPRVASSSSPANESLPVQTTLGIGLLGSKSVWGMDLVFSRNEIDIAVGLEYRLHGDMLFVRSGFRLENLAWGTNLTAGAGFSPRERMRIDYGFVLPNGGIQSTFGSHRFSIVYDF
ncbi:MAG: hypothetical protein OXN17_00375 [Candidatus Poribacteria bacterium]|nr:hypothetical protein [Candidatus Poribacteria bacterium]MDE0505465.1 hypothetical protein [Candidatus Poribacteria bacterium]